MPDLSTIGTLSGGSGRDLFRAGNLGGPGVASASFVMQLLLLLSGLSSCLVLLESFEFLSDSNTLSVSLLRLLLIW